MTTTPADLLLAFYGDDFTGSTDAMEALTRAGVPTVLFLQPPRPEQLARFPGTRAVGVAGTSRALPTTAMDAELTPVFRGLQALGAPLVHYKICSTFDSSPVVGSIGRAIEIGQAVFQSPWVPLLAGAPVLGRYCVFGNLFARSGPETEPFRLDRHPTMRCHPTTRMDESDLRVVLARQTNRRIGLVDVRAFADDAEAARQFAALRDPNAEIVLFDVLYDDHLAHIGRWIVAPPTGDTPRFAVGSSGIEYALAVHWRATGTLPPPPVFSAASVAQTIVVSGSCSPVTDRQIAWGVANGFDEVALSSERLVDPDASDAAVDEAIRCAESSLARGRSVVLHTGRGPNDPRIAVTCQHLEARGIADRSAELLGTAFGTILQTLMARSGVRRAVVAGGDTSSYAARALGIEALEMCAPMAPGSPLCRIHAAGPLDGAEIVFKGGQVGAVNFFGQVLG